MTNNRKSILGSFFLPRSQLSTKGRRYWVYGIVAFYLLGLIHWTLFFDLGQLKFNVHDWGLTAHYLSGLEQAVTTGQLPLHVLPTTPWHMTERFLTNPDLPVSPQVLLLPLLELGRFVVVDTLILFSIGFLGLYKLAKRFDLSGYTFGLLFLLFSFNGHITAHLGVGHIVWLAYFLTPFVILLILDAIERLPDRRWPVLISLVLFAIILQGAFHFAIWTAILLVLLAVTQPSLRRSTLVTVFLTVALGAVRFIPAAFEFSSRDWNFIGGFQAAGDIPIGLASLITPIEAANEHYGPPEWWEVDYFVGFVGLGVLAIFGFAYWLRNSNGNDGRSVRVLAPALIVMTFLSLDIVFRAISNLPIPFIGVERVSSRFFVLPFLFLLVFSVIALQRWLNSQKRGTAAQLLLIAAMVAIALDLMQHSRAWRPSAAQLGFEVFSPNMIVTIENRLDPAYFNALIAGAAITSIALIYCIWRLLRTPKRMTASAEGIEQALATESHSEEQ